MGLSITWFGHSAFALEADGRTVLIDPFLSGNPVATTDPESVQADTILLTHAHNDHVGDTVRIAKRTGATVIATFELANFIASQGVENTIGGNHGGTIAFDGGSTKFTPAWHTSFSLAAVPELPRHLPLSRSQAVPSGQQRPFRIAPPLWPNAAPLPEQIGALAGQSLPVAPVEGRSRAQSGPSVAPSVPTQSIRLGSGDAALQTCPSSQAVPSGTS